MSKKVNVKVVETVGDKTKRCLMKVYPDIRVSELKTQYLSLRDKENIAQDFTFVYDGKGLLDEKSLNDNGLNKLGQTYQVEISLKKDIKTFVEKKPEEPKAESVKIKVKLQEKVEAQMLGAEMEATSTMILEKITMGYCKHRKYNPLDYLFAYNGIILNPQKTLGEQGIGKTKEDAGKVYVISIHHKDKVQIKK